MALDLATKKCVPCEGGVPPLTAAELPPYLLALTLKWEVMEGRRITHLFSFKDFREAMVFVNRVADLAEAEGHHPDLAVSYNRVKVTLTTHAIGGLSENDFILARKIEQLVV